MGLQKRQAAQAEKMSVVRKGVSVIVFLSALCACRAKPAGEDPVPREPMEVAAEPRGGVVSRIAAYEAIEVTDGGVIRGTVRILGEVPEPAQILVQKDTEVCGLSVTNPAITLGPGNTVADVVVFLKGITKGKPLTPVGRTVEQQIVGCALVPRLELLSSRFYSRASKWRSHRSRSPGVHRRSQGLRGFPTIPRFSGESRAGPIRNHRLAMRRRSHLDERYRRGSGTPILLAYRFKRGLLHGRCTAGAPSPRGLARAFG